MRFAVAFTILASLAAAVPTPYDTTSTDKQVGKIDTPKNFHSNCDASNPQCKAQNDIGWHAVNESEGHLGRQGKIGADTAGAVLGVEGQKDLSNTSYRSGQTIKHDLQGRSHDKEDKSKPDRHGKHHKGEIANAELTLDGQRDDDSLRNAGHRQGGKGKGHTAKDSHGGHEMQVDRHNGHGGHVIDRRAQSGHNPNKAHRGHAHSDDSGSGSAPVLMDPRLIWGDGRSPRNPQAHGGHYIDRRAESGDNTNKQHNGHSHSKDKNNGNAPLLLDAHLVLGDGNSSKSHHPRHASEHKGDKGKGHGKSHGGDLIDADLKLETGHDRHPVGHTQGVDDHGRHGHGNHVRAPQNDDEDPEEEEEKRARKQEDEDDYGGLKRRHSELNKEVKHAEHDSYPAKDVGQGGKTIEQQTNAVQAAGNGGENGGKEADRQFGMGATGCQYHCDEFADAVVN